MHLLTGLYKPTCGTAKINGLDITTSMEQIRKSLGFVPQYNILFSILTVYEHLIFYAHLKGLTHEESLCEAEKMLDETGLDAFRDKYAKTLSGGLQRMLSIAIAFIGGSKTVILDEPTAGVDVGGRKSVWDILFKNKKGRTLLITTHHLDEADILSDRVAIISNGELIAFGSPYFLKKKFGNGYYLTFAKKPLITSSLEECSQNTLSIRKFRSEKILESFELDSLESDQSDKCLTDYMANKLPNAILVDKNCSQITYSIPNDSESTKMYEKIFSDMENNMSSLGIESIGISDTSLEEIFVKLVKQPKNNTVDINQDKKCSIEILRKKIKEKFRFNKPSPKTNLTDEEIQLFSSYTNLRVESKTLLYLQQAFALIVKRYHRTKRNVKGFLAETVLPVVFVCLALLVSNFAPSITDKPSLELHHWHQRIENKFFISKNSSTLFDRPNFNSNLSSHDLIDSSPKSISRVWNSMLESPGPGNRCLKNHKIFILNKEKTKIPLECETFDYKMSQVHLNDKKSFLEELRKSNFSQTKISLACDCSRGFPKCPKTAGGDYELRSIYKLKTTDLMYDLTGRNVSDWLIKTEFSNSMFQKRFGGFEFLNTDLKTKNFLLNWKIFSKSSFNLLNSISNFLNPEPDLELLNVTTKIPTSIYPSKFVKLWYNTKGHHANAAFLNMLNNAFLRSKLNITEEDPNEHGIVANNYPLKFSKTQFMSELEKRLLIDLFVAIFIIFGLSFIPASFLVFLVEERETNSKQLQFVSGVKPYIYWVSNFAWDLLNYILPSVICILIFLTFDSKTYTTKENFPCLVCLIFLYGWSCIPLMYPLNYMFKLAGTSFVISSSLNIFIGVGTTTATTVLNILTKEIPEMDGLNRVLKVIFITVFPHYCLGQGMLDMSILHNTAEIKRNFGYKAEFSPFDFQNVGRNLYALAFQGLVYFSLNLLIQYKFFVKSEMNLSEASSEEIQEEDVLNEKKRISEDKNSNDYIKLINLTKVYRKPFSNKEHLAVNSISMGIRKGECFGLLGLNGAGKSTTFKMITGEITPSSGDVIINNCSMTRETEKAYTNLGYCPQKNAIFPLLTASEHLVFYARLRGIPEQFIKDVTLWALNRFGLDIMADRISHGKKKILFF